MGFLERFRGVLTAKDTEDRAYTDMMLESSFRSVTVGRHVANAIQSATNLASLTMSRGAVTLEGPMADYWEPALTHGFLYTACRDLFLTGNHVSGIQEDEDGNGILQRASTFEMRGKKRPYRYRVEYNAPDGSVSKSLPESGVVHLRIGTEQDKPWIGVSPFDQQMILPNVEKGLLEYSRFPYSRMIPWNRYQDDDTGERNTTDQDRIGREMDEGMGSKSGVYALPNRGARGRPEALDHSDFRFQPDRYAVTLRKNLVDECFEAIGVPVLLRSEGAPGQTVRQEFGRWVDGYLQPLATIVAEELSVALETKVTWDMSPARVPLVTDQSVTVKNLVGAEMPLERALEIAGL